MLMRFTSIPDRKSKQNACLSILNVSVLPPLRLRNKCSRAKLPCRDPGSHALVTGLYLGIFSSTSVSAAFPIFPLKWCWQAPQISPAQKQPLASQNARGPETWAAALNVLSLKSRVMDVSSH